MSFPLFHDLSLNYFLTAPPRFTVLPRLTELALLAPIGTPEPDELFLPPNGIPDPADLVTGAVDGLLADVGNLLTEPALGLIVLVAAAADLLAVPVAVLVTAAGVDFGGGAGRALGCEGAGKALGCDFGGGVYIPRPKAFFPPLLLSLRPRGLPAVLILGTLAPV